MRDEYHSLDRTTCGVDITREVSRTSNRNGMDTRRQPNRCRVLLILISVLGIAFYACGYRVRSSIRVFPEGLQSVGVPTFQNLTSQYRVEQLLTKAVLQELNLQTRVPVSSSQSGVDAVLTGEILRVLSSPVTFDSRSFGSAFVVTVEMRLKLIRLKDSKITWQKPSFTFRERYALNNNVEDFFYEENPALERLARSFAASLVSIILESQPIDSPKP